MPMERSGDHRGGSMSGLYTYAVKHPAKDKCKQLHGKSEREKQPYDISKIWEYEVCISESAILVQRILRRYSRKEYKSDPGVYPESINNR